MLRLKSSRIETGATPSIDMTPMIDMVFQLLIFFMLTSIFASQPVLDLALPKAEHAKVDDQKEEVHLFIDREGALFVDQTAVPKEALRAVLKEKLEGGSKKTLLLSADQSVPFRFFVHVLDVTQGLGLRDLAIVTDPLVAAPFPRLSESEAVSKAGAPPSEERP